jgi:hypothetical protein
MDELSQVFEVLTPSSCCLVILLGVYEMGKHAQVTHSLDVHSVQFVVICVVKETHYNLLVFEIGHDSVVQHHE